MCNICQEPGTFPCSGLLEVLVIPVTRVSRGTTNNQAGLEDLGLRGEPSIVNQIGFGSDGIRERLEVN